jgi:hypothetical protein
MTITPTSGPEGIDGLGSGVAGGKGGVVVEGVGAVVRGKSVPFGARDDDGSDVDGLGSVVAGGNGGVVVEVVGAVVRGKSVPFGARDDDGSDVDGLGSVVAGGNGGTGIGRGELGGGGSGVGLVATIPCFNL